MVNETKERTSSSIRATAFTGYSKSNELRVYRETKEVPPSIMSLNSILEYRSSYETTAVIREEYESCHETKALSANKRRDVYP